MSACYSPSATKESWKSLSFLEFAEIWHAEGWNCYLQWKNIHCLGNVQSTKWQSAGPTLRGRSWRHVNRLLPPEASICHGLGCSVETLELFSDFCETECQSQHKCVHRWHFAPALCNMKQHFKNKDIIFQQDGALSRSTNFPWFSINKLWPPLLDDFKPMDFSVCSMLETEACRSPHTTVESLKESLVKAWAKMTQKKCIQQLQGSEDKLSK